MRAVPLSNRRNTRWWVSLEDISVSPLLHTWGVNELSSAKQAQIIAAICEGASIRSTARQAEVSKNTVTRLIGLVAQAADIYMDRAFRDLSCQRIEVDEIWAFCSAKDKNVPED